MPLLLALLLLLTCAPSGHAEHLVITPGGDEIPVTVHAADGERLLVWLSSEFGSTPRRTALAEALAAQGVEVWTPDLHAAWLLPPGRYSLNDVDPAAVSAIFTDAVGSGGKRDFPVLMDVEGEALRRWGIYAFPTTLVLDRKHFIRYAVFGAFDWSSQEVVDALSPLLGAGGRNPER